MSSSTSGFAWNTSLQGKVLKDQYKIQEKVAQGGMSWLYRVTHLLMDETMALKLLFPQLSSNPSTRARFIDEAKIQFKLHHPNIVRVSEIIQEGNCLGIIQEWVEGVSLKDYLRSCSSLLTLGQVRAIFEPILDAMHYAHERDVVHRDIKPSNILLHLNPETLEYTPKLADFGVAKILTDTADRTATGMTIGTFKFVSPEQIRDSKTVDQRADIYGLGVMLFQMATGKFPFTGSIEQLMFKHLMEPPPYPASVNPELSDELCQVILKALEKDPSQRFQTCEEMRIALVNAIPEFEPLFQTKPRRPRSDSTDPLSEGTPQPLSSTESAPALTSSGEMRRPMGLVPPPYWLESRPSGLDVVPPHLIDRPRHIETISFVAPLLSTGFDVFEESIFDDDMYTASVHSLELDLISHHVKSHSQDSVFLSIESESRETMDPASYAGESVDGLPAYAESNTSEPRGLFPLAIVVVLAVLSGGLWWFTQIHDQNTKPIVQKPPPRRVTLAPAPPRKAQIAVAPMCQDGDKRSCYTGPENTNQKGSCLEGMQICKDGKFGLCMGQILPQQETCNGMDDNCDGRVDEVFPESGKECLTRFGTCRYRGIWSCDSKQKQLKCTNKIPFPRPGAHQVHLNIKPNGKRFYLRFKRYRYRTRRAFCLEFANNLTVQVHSKGYRSCRLRLSQSTKSLQLFLQQNPKKMKKRNELTSYCAK